MTDANTESLREALNAVDAIQTREDVPQDEAIQLAILSELKSIRNRLDDIEVHTNNTVRKL